MIKVKCDTCGKIFGRLSYEHKRNLKLNRNEYCSRKCLGSETNNIIRMKALGQRENKPDISKYAGNRHDEFFEFKILFRRARHRQRNDFEITLEDLRKQWEKQNGLCSYTKIKLTLPTYLTNNEPLRTASLDRIDSSKGYCVGNIQFTSIAANWAKNKMTHEQMLEFCKMIRIS